MNTAYSPLLLMLFLLILFTWNKWRYDLVAMFGLLLAVTLNMVPIEKAFLGFAHPAVILVAAALMISQALQSSGALQALLGLLPVEGRALPLQLLMVCSVTVLLSAFINNVAAVALMIPFVISLAYKSDRSARLYLMPIAFSLTLRWNDHFDWDTT
jgi:di/tricarboxylate transporter